VREREISWGKKRVGEELVTKKGGEVGHATKNDVANYETGKQFLRF